MKSLLIDISVLWVSMVCMQDPSYDKEKESLAKLKFEIKQLASSIECINSEDWEFCPLGRRPCGGPVEYVAYSSRIDTTQFLNLVRNYRAEQIKFNRKWNMVGICVVPPRPSGVKCEKGKAVFTY